MRDIIYLHGFGSSGNSFKGKFLKEEFNKNAITPTLLNNPCSDIATIKKLINYGNKPLLIGSSLGGFYAEYLSKTLELDSILINPLTNILDIKPYIGTHKYFDSNKEFNFTKQYYTDLLELQNDIKDYSPKSEKRVILVSKDDTIINYKKSIKHFVFSNEKVNIYNTGGHSFNNKSIILKTIKDFL